MFCIFSLYHKCWQMLFKGGKNNARGLDNMSKSQLKAKDWHGLLCINCSGKQHCQQISLFQTYSDGQKSLKIQLGSQWKKKEPVTAWEMGIFAKAFPRISTKIKRSVIYFPESRVLMTVHPLIRIQLPCYALQQCNLVSTIFQPTLLSMDKQSGWILAFLKLSFLHLGLNIL